ncbi:hypothetical protein EUGRSUZ_I01245 [Eucalyptus grandis]|uniref:Uncharacterized protein n=2 Tax=Eucalyptus grandis TaxID=71139 RepID=A0ACC3JF23_EUCGR|nr:hypothetical protein EUGRSUZ_I01245 [Eucalyptus grandis]
MWLRHSGRNNRTDQDDGESRGEDHARDLPPSMEVPELLVELALPELQLLEHGDVVPVDSLEDAEELLGERVTSSLEVLQLLQRPGIPVGPSSPAALIQGGEEVEGLEAVLEVFLHQLEQLLSPPDVLLAVQDDPDHLLVHLHEAPGDLPEGVEGQRSDPDAGSERLDGMAGLGPEVGVEGTEVGVRHAGRLVGTQLRRVGRVRRVPGVSVPHE